MRTVVNPTGQTIVVPWCIVPGHWSGGLHSVPLSSAQSDAFDGFETALPDVLNIVTIPPGSSLVFDEQQLNGLAIDIAVLAGGMT